ncbi:unnamed protein product [Prunus armeniaca]|uniref:Uncharacterized protein n=1 Tax=Prunus armeniaca TaxID=36596 RepID=A0A6J5XXH5_PRUAR|nr:unnamed protein product [Prunus armeniaca]
MLKAMPIPGLLVICTAGHLKSWLCFIQGQYVSLSSNTTGGVVYVTEKLSPRLAKDPTTKELFMILHNTSFAYEKDPIIPQSLLGHNYVIPPQTKGFQVFKLEGNNNGPEWVEVEDLGGDRDIVPEQGKQQAHRCYKPQSQLWRL